MESYYTTLRLHIPIEERGCLSPSLLHCRGPTFPSKVPLRYQQGPTSRHEEEEEEEEEGPSEPVDHDRADKFGPTDKEASLEASDVRSERWLTELLPLCSECRAVVGMGNQQGAKHRPNCRRRAEGRSASPRSSKTQASQKRRRRVVEGVVGSLQATPRAPLKARKMTAPQGGSSPSFGRWNAEEGRPVICTPAARRKKVNGREKEDGAASTLGFKAGRREKLPDGFYPTTRLKEPPKQRLKERHAAAADSDSDLSEYDNEIYSHCTTNTKDEDTEKGDAKSVQRKLEEMEKMAAARRVTGKIEEVEGIIRRVSLSSWIRDAGEGEDGPAFVSDGGAEEEEEEEEVRERRVNMQAELGAPSSDKHPLVAELHALGEALSQSLQQALRMEAGNREHGALVQNGRPEHAPSRPHCFTSARSAPAGAELFPPPSPSFAAVQDASSSWETSSPVLSPLLSSTPVRLGRTERQQPDAAESHRASKESFSALKPGGRKSVNTETEGVDEDRRNPPEQWTRSRKDHLLSSDEALQRQEEIWQQEVEESLSRCRSLFHPSRPKHIDFLRITAPDDDITDAPTPPPEPRVSASRDFEDDL